MSLNGYPGACEGKIFSQSILSVFIVEMSTMSLILALVGATGGIWITDLLEAVRLVIFFHMNKDEKYTL